METNANVTTSVAEETVTETAPHDENLTEDTLDEAIENFTLDDLMAYSEEQDPLFADNAQHKGMKPLHEWIHNVPEDVRKHLANIRADYTRKSQDLARMRKEVEEAQRAMQQQSEGIMNGNLAQQLSNIDTESEYDLFDPEGMKAEIQRQAQLMLKEMLAPAQEEIKAKQRAIELDRFKAENPELTDPTYRQPIIELLKARPELRLEDAFYIVKARIGSQHLEQEREELAARRARSREVVRKSSSGSRSNPSGTPKFKNALEAYKWHKAQQVKK